MVQNSLSFCLSEKLLISPSYLNEILAWYNNLGCRLFSFIFSILVSRLLICDSILISRFWINFTIIIRNSLSGPLLVWWAFILFLYLLAIPLSLHLVYIAEFGPFCILAVDGVLFIVVFPRCVWVCAGGLSRFLG